MSPMIRTQGLTRDFGATRALDGVTLELEPGAPVGLVGPNGAGKTTLFSILCGFLAPTRGTVEVFGRPPLHADLHGRVAILPQDAALVRGVPIVVQLQLFAELQGMRRAEARREAERVLELVLLSEARDRPPEALSHGMLKRVGIAQAFIGTPELVLLDEPTAGLDPNTASHIKNVIRSLDRERTFVISSHNLADIEELCGSVVILTKGKVTEHRAVGDLVARTSVLSFRLEAEAPDGIEERLSAIDGVTGVERGAPGERRLTIEYRETDGQPAQIRILQGLAAAGVSFVEMTRGRSLEDKVRELTRK